MFDHHIFLKQSFLKKTKKQKNKAQFYTQIRNTREMFGQMCENIPCSWSVDTNLKTTNKLIK